MNWHDNDVMTYKRLLSIDVISVGISNEIWQLGFLINCDNNIGVVKIPPPSIKHGFLLRIR